MSKITAFRSAFFPLAVTLPKNPKMGGIPRLWNAVLVSYVIVLVFVVFTCNPCNPCNPLINFTFVREFRSWDREGYSRRGREYFGPFSTHHLHYYPPFGYLATRKAMTWQRYPNNLATRYKLSSNPVVPVPRHRLPGHQVLGTRIPGTGYQDTRIPG